MTESRPRLNQFGAHYTIATRWEDEDAYGHINNVKYYSFFDTAVNGWLIQATQTDIRELEAIGLVAQSSCEFHAPMKFPLLVTAGIAVDRLGRSSVTYRLGLFQDDAEKPAATGTFVHVYVDSRSRQSVPIPAEIRDVLEPLVG